MTQIEELDWQVVCSKNDLVEGSGVCALIRNVQVAIFYLPNESPPVYALENLDPFGKANVISRGIVGDLEGQLVVASPLFKQHFSLSSGYCLEDESTQLAVYEVRIVDDDVLVKGPRCTETNQSVSSPA